MTALAGAGQLVRLALRRDRVLLPVWLSVFLLFAYTSAAATVDLFPTVRDRVLAAESINASTPLVALYGRIYDPTSLGAIAMVKAGGLGAVLVAVLAAVVVVRHTRAEEETGRLELLGATVVGRHAALAAALVVGIGMSLTLGVLTALVLAATGLPLAGSAAFGASWAATGAVFSGLAATAAQLTRSARAATGLSGAILAAAYLLRAVGDTTGDPGPTWPTWLSPIGWSQQVRPFAGDRWGLLLVTAALTAAAVAVAHLLVARRDLGAGLLPDRAGSPTASAVLSTPLGLAWRLQRGTLLAWSAGFLVGGFVIGAIAGDVSGLVDSPQARELFTRLGGEKGLSDAFLAAELGFIGVFTCVFAIQAALRLRGEETSLHAEHLLATPLGRVRWAASHLVVSATGSAALLTVLGVTAGTAHAVSTGDAAQVGRVLAAALVQWPVTLLFTGIVAATFGLAPRLTAVAWGVLVGALLLGEVGPLLELDQWVLDLSPFAHVPKLPGSALDPVPLLALAAVAVALVAAGLAGFRRRDVG